MDHHYRYSTSRISSFHSSHPEFSIICRTHGGPTTSVLWYLPNNDFVNVEPGLMENYTNYETSTVVISTFHNCVYENRLRVRGNHSGSFIYTLFIHYYQTIDSVFAMSWVRESYLCPL